MSEIDRLTNKDTLNVSFDTWELCGLDSECKRDCWKPTPCKIPQMVRKLAAYEDAEEQGLLIKLPCRVGDTVYVIAKCENILMHRDDDYFTGTGEIECPFENQCEIEDCDDEHKRIFETVITGVWYGRESEMKIEMFLEDLEITAIESDFGKTVFLTKEAAEKALPHD